MSASQRRTDLPRIEDLTPRQREIVEMLVVQGLTYAEVALTLDISPNTVENHVQAVAELLPSLPGSRRARITWWYLTSTLEQPIPEPGACKDGVEEDEQGPFSTPAWVYLMEGENGLVKIGFAIDPVERLIQLQRASPMQLKLVLVIPGGRTMEAQLHHEFRHFRSRGEWYRLPQQIIRELLRKFLAA